MALYGITHTMAGAPIVRLAKTLKVGIGYPKGRAIHVYIDAAGKWCVELGATKETRTVERLGSKQEAQAFYKQRLKTAPDRKFPAKFGYFTFSRVGIDGSFTPDFDAIEIHGPLPTEVPIVFLDNDPLRQQMEWWTAAELKCSGDGRNALRRCTSAQSPDEKRLADAAKVAGEQFFELQEKCFAQGCPLAKGEKPVCKPHTRLSFQLANAPALGTTCTFDSTGFRSASQLFSSLLQIRQITGRGNPEGGPVAGVPLRLKLLPYKTSHNGTPSTQFGVTLHLSATDALDLMRGTLQRADEFHQLSVAPLMIEGVAEDVVEGEVLPESYPSTAQEEEGEPLSEQAEATAMSGEFYPEGERAEGEFEIQDEPDEPEFEPEPTATIRRKSEQVAAPAAPAAQPMLDDWGDPIKEQGDKKR